MKAVLCMLGFGGLLVMGRVVGAAPPVTGGTASSHEVVFIGADNNWSSPPDYTGFLIYHTASAGAPPLQDGDNIAQVIADLLNAGYHVEPALGQVLFNSTAFVK